MSTSSTMPVSMHFALTLVSHSAAIGGATSLRPVFSPDLAESWIVSASGDTGVFADQGAPGRVSGRPDAGGPARNPPSPGPNALSGSPMPAPGPPGPSPAPGLHGIGPPIFGSPTPERPAPGPVPGPPAPGPPAPGASVPGSPTVGTSTPGAPLVAPLAPGAPVLDAPTSGFRIPRPLIGGGPVTRASARGSLIAGDPVTRAPGPPCPGPPFPCPRPPAPGNSSRGFPVPGPRALMAGDPVTRASAPRSCGPSCGPVKCVSVPGATSPPVSGVRGGPDLERVGYFDVVAFLLNDHGKPLDPLNKLPETFLEDRVPTIFISISKWSYIVYPQLIKQT
uniref:Uncharacterized protein n=1 Tax=Glossina austeni TaxID=7395 RepID=A0A1A9VVX1_GLOAU